jgi:hypothetical protein
VTEGKRGGPPPRHELDRSDVVLSELVSRVLDKGVVVKGDVTISVAGVELVHLDLNLRLASTETLIRHAHAAKQLPPDSTEKGFSGSSGSTEKDR